VSATGLETDPFEGVLESSHLDRGNASRRSGKSPFTSMTSVGTPARAASWIGTVTKPVFPLAVMSTLALSKDDAVTSMWLAIDWKNRGTACFPGKEPAHGTTGSR
jgi:hypothetical protein